MINQNQELEKLKSLLLSGLEENINLALILAEARALQTELNGWLKEEFKELISLVAKDKYNCKACKNFAHNGYDWENITALIACLLELNNLEYLNLDNNNLTQLPESICNLTNLKELDLRRDKLTKLPDSVGKLTNLTRLWLRDNQITKNEKERIKKALPNCNINF